MAQALSREAWSDTHCIEACSFYNSSDLHLPLPPRLVSVPGGLRKTERCWDERMALFTNSSNKASTSFKFTSFLQRYSLYFSHLSSFWAFKGLKRPETVRESSLFMVSNKLNLIQTLFNEHLFYTNKLTVSISLIKLKGLICSNWTHSSELIVRLFRIASLWPIHRKGNF